MRKDSVLREIQWEIDIIGSSKNRGRRFSFCLTLNQTRNNSTCYDRRIWRINPIWLFLSQVFNMWTIYFHGLRPKLTALSERRWQLRETPEEQSLSLTDTVPGSFGPKISTTKKWEKMPFHQLTDMLCLDVKQGCVANILAKVIISRLQECLSQTKHRLPRMILSFVSGSVSNTKDWFYWLLERNQSRISS